MWIISSIMKLRAFSVKKTAINSTLFHLSKTQFIVSILCIYQEYILCKEGKGRELSTVAHGKHLQEGIKFATNLLKMNVQRNRLFEDIRLLSA